VLDVFPELALFELLYAELVLLLLLPKQPETSTPPNTRAITRIDIEID
jgi:hypothetical protein